MCAMLVSTKLQSIVVRVGTIHKKVLYEPSEYKNPQKYFCRGLPVSTQNTEFDPYDRRRFETQNITVYIDLSLPTPGYPPAHTEIQTRSFHECCEVNSR